MMATEKRLICLDEALEATHNEVFWTGSEQAAVRSFLVKLPRVDAVEVMHGKWIKPYMNRYGHPCHCCSVCGFKASYQDKNYCPNCGAKMDGHGDE